MYCIHLFRCYWWLKLKSWASQRLHIFASSSPATKCVCTWKPSHAHKPPHGSSCCKPPIVTPPPAEEATVQCYVLNLAPYFRCRVGSCHHIRPSCHQVQPDVWCLRVNCHIDDSGFCRCFIIWFMLKLTLGAVGITSSSCSQTWVISKTAKWSV